MDNTNSPEKQALSRALKASRIPAGIGAFLGISGGMKAGSTVLAKLMLGLITAAIIGVIFGAVAFISVYLFHKLRGK